MNSKNQKNHEKNVHEMDEQVELDVRDIAQQLGIPDHTLEQVVTLLEKKEG
ncbi:hypothetical protein [Paenibacillus nasutitermitis]|uniref:Uncharacterized protein n=1 Tax=Paenibacillus nasutitermitis TaxID=1652958 RepID=A0A917DXK4_9BACL|nr:hypothetical protein [Paenibacillus nasutitermitis]GGD76266.1 hypothetical protein GCM10010911_37910 [Paenibacillus nasutitermitis]